MNFEFKKSFARDLKEKASELIEKIEGLGGAFKCWEAGWFRKELADSANAWQEAINNGKKVLVGVNKYCLENDSQQVNVFKHDPKAEQDAVRRVKRYKANRDQVKVHRALENLAECTERFLAEWPGSCGTLMPSVIEAAEAKATIGEIQKVLREKCGYGYTF